MRSNLTVMRRTCERPGCGAPSAVIYGYGTTASGANALGLMWLDAWSPERDPSDAPADVRGVVCARHGALLSPPRGWTLDDRRESIPRLFKPRDRAGLSVVPDVERRAPKKVKADPPTIRRSKANNLPRPRLFADPDESAPAVSPPTSPVETEAVMSHAPEPTGVEARRDDSTELLIGQDGTALTSRTTKTFDPDEDFPRDVSGSMLRDALRPRLSGRFDPTAELLRPTDIESEHA